MTGKTIVEGILSRAAEKDCRPGDIVVVPIAKLMSGEGRTPDGVQLWEQLGKGRGMDPQNVALFMDHMATVPSLRAAMLHSRMRRWAAENKWQLFDVGMGISHGIFPDRGWILPGEVIACADGHSCTYGALNAFAMSMSASEVAIVLQTGKLWFEVPKTIRVSLHGRLARGVTAKDVILFLAGRHGADGANGCCVEFDGAVVEAMGVDARLTLANMVVEMGGACGLMACNEAVLQFVRARADRPFEPVIADSDARYDAHWEYDLSGLEPHVACPPRHDNVVPLSQVVGRPITMVFLGSCTNGRYEDLAAAAEVMQGRSVAPGVRMFISPASRDALLRAEAAGIIRTLIEAGALLLPPGCGACAADVNGAVVAADDDVIVATSSRNYQGRMGNDKALIYLSSPAVAAAAAVSGELRDPRNL
jgi:3-isopropylmalate/(R)-2-methylmalate dehydratase large subunit